MSQSRLRSVVVDYQPAFLGQLAEYQCKQASSRSGRSAGESQVPMTAHERSAWTEHLYPQIRKFKVAHLMASALIPGLIPRYSFVPTRPRSSCGKESQIGGLPVARHEAFEVVPVPVINLAVKHRADL